MSIALCDKDVSFLETTKNKVESFFDGKSEVCTFERAEDFLACVQNGKTFNILITDIELGGELNGIEAVKRLNILLPECKVVYLTGKTEYVSDVYETSHEYLVLKDAPEEKLTAALRKSSLTGNGKSRLLYVDSKTDRALVDSNTIMFIERDKRMSRIYCVDGRIYTVSKKLDELLAELDGKMFARCHNSFVVGFYNVKKYKNSAFFFKDGYKVSVSRTYKKEVDKAFCAYVGKLAQ